MTLRQRITEIEDDLRAARAELQEERRQRNEAIRNARQEGKTLGQIARSFGVSREWVRQISAGSPLQTAITRGMLTS